MPRCPTCERPLEARPAGSPPRSVGAVSATVEGAPTWACPHGHVAGVTDPELTSRLTDALTDAAGDQLLLAPRTRLRRQLRCGRCDAALTVPGRRTTRSVATVVDGVGVVTATFDLPALRCPDCGLEQVPEEVFQRDVRAAIAAALA